MAAYYWTAEVVGPLDVHGADLQNYMADMAFAQREGYCEACGRNPLQTALVLAAAT